MRKRVFVLTRRDGVSHADFARAYLEGAGRRLAGAPGLRRAVLFAAEESDALLREPGAQGRPSRCDAVAMSWLDVPGHAEPTRGAGVGPEAEALLARLDGYLVEEVVHWDDLPGGAPGEGVALLYFGRRLPGQGREDFVRRYRDGHAPLARQHHPGIARYVQGFVVRPLTPGAPALDSVAELHFRSLEDYRRRFYRDETSPGIIARDVAGFLDGKRTWAVAARERPVEMPAPG